MSDLCKKILNLGREKKYDDLQSFVSSTDTEQLKQAIVEQLGTNQGNALWNFLLMAFSNVDKNDKKRFEVVMSVLQKMNKTELKMKQTVELITRLNVELPKFSSKQLIQLAEYCLESIRMGDPKCVGWKDLLPGVIKLINGIPEISANDVQMPGEQFRNEYVRSVLTMKWPTAILTPLTSMFKEMILTKDEQTTALEKICHNLHSLHPDELPSLSHQIFALCTTPVLIIKPILSFEKYFYKFYYKRLWEDLSSVSTVSSIDSIDPFSPEELRNSEDTIIFYLGKATELCISEKDLVTFLRCLAATPRYILNPFGISAMLSMSNVNRYSELTNTSSSCVLPFLRNVVRNNEIEKEMCQKSKWCRDTLDRPIIDLEMIFKVLIEHSQKGNDVVTKGIIDFAFTLLKTPKHIHLHELAINFLVKFIRDRYIFGKGVIKKLVEFLFADQGALQYSECLTRISNVNSVSMSECPDIIQHILASFLLIPGNCAIRMMCIITPLIKKSIKIRDMLIETLRKSMYQRETATRQFGVYGFCLILKQLHNNNAKRVTGRNGNCTQLSISGYSLMSQSTFGNENNPQRNFDMMTLEIIGLLRKTFQQTYEIKEILYEGLTKAIHSNPKLTPHIIEFLDWHFRSFFEITTLNFEIKFDIVVRQRIDGIEIWDQLGKLIYLMADCVVLCEQKELAYNTYSMKKMLNSMMDRIDNISLDILGLTDSLDQRMHIVGCQFLNCLEALINYSIWSATKVNSHLGYTIKLYKQHLRVSHVLKEATGKKKKSKKADKGENTSANNSTLPQSTQSYEFKSENIWTLNTLKRLLQIIFSDEIFFATAEQTSAIRSNQSLVRYILSTTCSKVENLRLKNSVELRNSATTFKEFCGITAIIYEKCIKKIATVYEKYGHETAQVCGECFRQCLLVQNEMYSQKLSEFLKFLTFETLTDGQLAYKIVSILHGIIPRFLDNEKEDDADKLVLTLFQCLEIFYEIIPEQDPESFKCFNWLLSICKDNEMKSDLFEIVHKLLFEQQIKTDFGNFFESVAIQIKNVLGSFNTEEETVNPRFEMKSINSSTVTSSCVFLCQSIKSQIEHVEYFITKAKSFYAKIRIAGKNSSETCIQTMKVTEMKICSQLIYIANTLHHLTNSLLPLGQCLDLMEKVVIQYYICMTNLTKHLTLRHSIIPFSPRETKFEQLLQVAGRPLATRIYELITHIEEEIFRQDQEAQENRKKKLNTKADKAKVLRETKLLPKLIMRIENFNKFVIFLSKKTTSELSIYLHIGSVRDFRILSKPLRDCLNQTLQDANNFEIDESQLQDTDHEDSSSIATDEQLTTTNPQLNLSDISSSTSSSVIRENVDSDVTNMKIAIKNLEKINEKSRRKRSAELVDDTEKSKVSRKKKKQNEDGMATRKSGRSLRKTTLNQYE